MPRLRLYSATWITTATRRAMSCRMRASSWSMLLRSCCKPRSDMGQWRLLCESAQDLLGRRQVDAAVRDALPVAQLARHALQVLATRDQMALQHHSEDVATSVPELLAHVGGDRPLPLVILPAVRVAAV